MSAQILKKISSRTVAGDKLVRLDVKDSPEEVVLFDAYGVIQGTKVGTTDKGDWLAFVGDIEAVTPDGAIYRSPRVFVPQPYQDMLFSALMSAKEADETGSVQFAVRVSIVKPAPGKVSAVGYEYRATPLVSAEDTSPMKAIRDQAKSALLALSAPKTEGNVAKLKSANK